MDRYQYLGISFIGFAIPVAFYSYFILNNIPLTAFGLSTLILGFALLQVPPSPMPATQIRVMLSASYIIIEALLEEFDANGSAIYFLSSGRVNAFIPLEKDSKISHFNTINLKNRVITRFGDIDGLLVFPPGSELVRLANLSNEINLEDALNSVLVDLIESVDSVKCVQEIDTILVELFNSKEESKFDRVEKSLGLNSVSVAGCIIAQVLGEPILYKKTEEKGSKSLSYFKILPG